MDPISGIIAGISNIVGGLIQGRNIKRAGIEQSRPGQNPLLQQQLAAGADDGRWFLYGMLGLGGFGLILFLIWAFKK
ncbi:MAG: hypothetical protein HRU12_17720 [Phaeodactylibacter sp.]|nr:hypothetical protein [Phaeodactylibacter sp.]